MDADTARFDDEGEFLWRLADVFLVRCPRCGRMARTGADRKARLTCVHCGLSRDRAPGAKEWTGPVCAWVKGRCGTCGRPFRRGKRLPRPPARRTTSVACAGCGARTEERVQWVPLHAPEPREPHFGLDLWLQTPCRGHTLWAYNERHLAFLERYVGATLRKRRPHVNRSLASRLPRWMLLADRRDDVMECLGRLRAMLPTA